MLNHVQEELRTEIGKQLETPPTLEDRDYLHYLRQELHLVKTRITELLWVLGEDD